MMNTLTMDELKLVNGGKMTVARMCELNYIVEMAKFTGCPLMTILDEVCVNAEERIYVLTIW